MSQRLTPTPRSPQAPIGIGFTSASPTRTQSIDSTGLSLYIFGITTQELIMCDLALLDRSSGLSYTTPTAETYSVAPDAEVVR